MDPGIPTEEILGQMRTAETPIDYLVGTPRGRLSKLEKEFLKLPWEQVRESVQVKLIEQAGELFISCQKVRARYSRSARCGGGDWKGSANACVNSSNKNSLAMNS
jgi:hypothetical protein